MKKRKYIRFGIVFLVPLVFIFSQCFHDTKPADVRGAEYAGSATCLKCHKNIYRNYLHAAHYLTSRAATQPAIGGSFNPDSNTVVFNDSVKVVLEKHKDGLYQVKYVNGKPAEKARFDIVFGRKHAETYLSWKGDEVHEMPVSYYLTLHKWANSPGGYYNDSVNYSRVIHERCFECHSSYIKNLSNTVSAAENTDSLDKSSLILGIDCERCHGPGSRHVNFHTENPQEKQAMYITKISTLTRLQRIDLCSVCHSGNTDVMIKSTFDFKPGDTLANYSGGSRSHRVQEAINTDVHGNQVKLITSSKCFLNSKIECATCHTIHDNQVKSIEMYSQICTGCHSEATHNVCKLTAQIGTAINSNCIDCHMPVKSSNAIVINGAGKTASPPFLARTHLIAIYPEESKKVAALLKPGTTR